MEWLYSGGLIIIVKDSCLKVVVKFWSCWPATVTFWSAESAEEIFRSGSFTAWRTSGAEWIPLKSRAQMSCWWGIWGNNWGAVLRMFHSSKLEFIELFSRAGVLFVHQNHVNRLAKDKIVDADGSLLLYEALGGKARGFSKLRLTKYGEPWPLLRCYLAAGMVFKRCFVSKRLIEWWFPVIQDGLMNFLSFPSCKNLGFRKPLALASLFTGVLIRLGWGSIPFHDFHSSPHCKKFQRSSCQELGHTIWSSAYKTQGLFNWLLGKRGAKPGGTQTLRWRNASTPLYNAINSKPFYTGCLCEKFETMRKAREIPWTWNWARSRVCFQVH